MFYYVWLRMWLIKFECDIQNWEWPKPVFFIYFFLFSFFGFENENIIVSVVCELRLWQFLNLSHVTGVYTWCQLQINAAVWADIVFVWICLWYFQTNLVGSTSIIIRNLVAKNQPEHITIANNLTDYRHRQFHCHKWLNNSFNYDPKIRNRSRLSKTYAQIDVPKNDLRELL